MKRSPLRRVSKKRAKENSVRQVQEYQWLHIQEFKKRLGLKGKEDALQYIALMSLMGNDFLPHFPALNIRTNGIYHLIEIYKQKILQL